MSYPEHWQSRTFESISEEIVKSGPEDEEEFDYIEISSINNRTKKVEDVRNTSAEEASSRAKQRVKSGDVLISKVRPKLNGVAIVPEEYDGAIATTGFYIVRSSKVIPKYIFYYVQTQQFIRDMDNKATGTSYPSVNLEHIRNHEVPVPSLPEQEDIVAQIEKLLTNLDVGLNELENSEERLKRYKNSVQEVALNGTLTKNWREDNTPEAPDKRLDKIEEKRYEQWVYYEREKKQRRGENVETDRWKNKYSSPLELTVDDLPDLPQGWVWTTLDSVTAYDVDYRGKTPPYSDSGIPVISSGNVQNGKIEIDSPKYVSEETYDEWLTRGVPESGDLLITTEAPPGDTALFPQEEKYLPTRRIITCKTVGVENRYLQLCFTHPVVEKYIRENSRGTTVERILKDTLFETPIPLPPLEEQREIIAQLERHDTVIENTLEVIKENLQKGENMRQAIVAKAFEGEFTTGTTDETKRTKKVTEDAETVQLRLEDV